MGCTPKTVNAYGISLHGLESTLLRPRRLQSRNSTNGRIVLGGDERAVRRNSLVSRIHRSAVVFAHPVTR